MENDYSLLRAFDLEKAKAGEAICISGTTELANYVAGPDNRGCLIIDVKGRFHDYFNTAVRMAPLCWVEGKPVYKGDVLYRKMNDLKATAWGIETDGGRKFLAFKEVYSPALLEDVHVTLTWTPPQPAAPSEYDRLAKIINDGRADRDSGADCPYAPKTIESLVHMQGWVQRDLRIALDKARAENRKLVGDGTILTCTTPFGGDIFVPQKVVDAAHLLGEFFSLHNINYWKLGKCQSRVDTSGKTSGFINVYPSARGYRGDSPARIDGLYASRTDADCFAGSDRVDCIEVFFTLPSAR